jgi:hypothetical protein
MSDLFLNPYLRWLRDRSQGVPSFNIGASNAPSGEVAPTGQMLAAPVPPQYPAWPQTLSSTSGSQRPAPSANLPGLWVKSQDNLPGFNLKPQAEQIGFNLNQDDRLPSEGTWPDAPESAPDFPDTTQTGLPPFVEGPPLPAPSGIPDWPYNVLLGMPLKLLRSVLDPRTGTRVLPPYPPTNQDTRGIGDTRAYVDGVNPPADQDSVETPSAERWPSSDTPEWPAGIDAGPDAATVQNANPEPTPQEPIWTAWPQPPMGGWPYSQAGGAERRTLWPAAMIPPPIGVPPIPPVGPVADSNFVLANAGYAGKRRAQPQRLLPQDQPTQQRIPVTPLGTGLASRLPALPIAQKPGVGTTELGHRPEQEFSNFIEAYRRQADAQGRRAILAQRSQLPNRAWKNHDLISSPQVQMQGQQLRDAVDRFNRLAFPGLDSDRPPTRSTAGIPGRDLNIHPAGDGDTPSDLSSIDRHRLGVRASIATHVKRGFELVTDKEVAVDVPGFPYPRYYDYIIRDPVTGRNYGVEVKTTLYETIRLKREQVMKDAIVATQGANVRTTGWRITGVSYAAYCFGCEAFDLRSEKLEAILRSAGVRVRRGSLPGDIQP